jgi:hypothetical protein
MGVPGIAGPGTAPLPSATIRNYSSRNEHVAHYGRDERDVDAVDPPGNEDRKTRAGFANALVQSNL